MYVSPNGNDTPTCGAQANPCQTIQYSVSSIADISNLFLLGSYFEISGVTLRTSMTVSSTMNTVLDCRGSNGFTLAAGAALSYSFIGLEWRNCFSQDAPGAAVYAVGTGNVDLRNCTFRNNSIVVSSTSLSGKLVNCSCCSLGF